MILINNGTNPLAHNGVILRKGERKDIPNEIAKEWLKIYGVEEFLSGADVEKATAEADKRVAELETENAKLREEIAKLKEDVEKATAEAELEVLKTEAQALGIQFAPNISAAKLQEKINAHKKAEE